MKDLFSVEGKVALVTTKGFRDLLEIGRQTRPHMYSLTQDHPPPLVAREHRFELDERITAGGAVLRAPCDADITAVIDSVRQSGAEACAVCFSGSDETREAFTLTTVFMSALPLTMIGSIVGWLVWRVRRLHAETAAAETLPLAGEREI